MGYHMLLPRVELTLEDCLGQCPVVPPPAGSLTPMEISPQLRPGRAAGTLQAATHTAAADAIAAAVAAGIVPLPPGMRLSPGNNAPGSSQPRKPKRRRTSPQQQQQQQAGGEAQLMAALAQQLEGVFGAGLEAVDDAQQQQQLDQQQQQQQRLQEDKEEDGEQQLDEQQQYDQQQQPQHEPQQQQQQLPPQQQLSNSAVYVAAALDAALSHPHGVQDWCDEVKPVGIGIYGALDLPPAVSAASQALSRIGTCVRSIRSEEVSIRNYEHQHSSELTGLYTYNMYMLMFGVSTSTVLGRESVWDCLVATLDYWRDREGVLDGAFRGVHTLVQPQHFSSTVGDSLQQLLGAAGAGAPPSILQGFTCMQPVLERKEHRSTDPSTFLLLSKAPEDRQELVGLLESGQLPPAADWLRCDKEQLHTIMQAAVVRWVQDGVEQLGWAGTSAAAFPVPAAEQQQQGLLQQLSKLFGGA